MGGCADQEQLSSDEQDLAPAPTNLTATVIAPDKVDLSWNAVPGATAYVVQRGPSPGTETNLTTVNPPTATTYHDSHLSSGTQYCYDVRANVTGQGASGPSNEVCVTTFGTPTAPTNVMATAVSSSSIVVSWDPVTNATAYYVYMAVGASTTYSQIGSTTAPTTTLTVQGLSPSTSYSFEVRAAITTTLSGFSSPPATATTFPAGIEGYYRFDDKTGTSAVDSSPYGRTGTLANGAAFSTATQAPLVDANDHNPSSLSLPTAAATMTAAVPVTFGTDGSIALWINLSAAPTGNVTFVGRRDASCGAQLWALGEDTTGLYFAGVANSKVYFGQSLPLNTWTHVAVTAHFGAARLYINGALVTTGSFQRGGTTANTFTVGDAGGCGNTASFFVDELKAFTSQMTDSDVAVLGVRPTPPTNLNLVQNHSTFIQIGWTAPGTGADGYYIYKGSAAGNEAYFTSHDATTTFTASHLQPSQTTSWEVRARKNGLLSDFSNELLATTLPPPPPPTNLMGTISTCCTPKRVDLSWTAEPRAVRYLVYQQTGTTGTFALIGQPVGTTLQAANLVSGQTYSWQVKSLDDGNTISTTPSNTVTITMP